MFSRNAEAETFLGEKDKESLRYDVVMVGYIKVNRCNNNIDE